MASKTDPQQLVERMRALQQTGIAWMARQAVGDAVLMLLRDRELTRDTLHAQLLDMADGKVPSWDGARESARKAAQFILEPPAELPSPSPEKGKQ